MKLFFFIFAILFVHPHAIFPQSLTVTHYSDLSFGDVFIGYSSDIPHTDPAAAKFSVVPRGRRNIRITFTLPASLSNNQSSIPVTFNFAHSAYSFNDLPYGRTNFNPYSALSVGSVSNNQYVYIWLGGTISIPIGSTPGTYQGTIILTAETY